jgi:surfeit locus 1 family protein
MRVMPIFATAIVLAAAGVMIALGVWQLHRADWKTDLIARYENALTDTKIVHFPAPSADKAAWLYRRSAIACGQLLGRSAISGRSNSGQPGWTQLALCGTDQGEAEVALGWSRDPAPASWTGGNVSGLIAPAGKSVRLIADPPLAGLEALARPDPREMPNNHFAYAMQWFFFAATSLIIFVLAARKKWSEK